MYLILFLRIYEHGSTAQFAPVYLFIFLVVDGLITHETYMTQESPLYDKPM